MIKFSEGEGFCDGCEKETHLILIHTKQEIPLGLCVKCEEELLHKLINSGGWKWILTTD